MKFKFRGNSVQVLTIFASLFKYASTQSKRNCLKLLNLYNRKKMQCVFNYLQNVVIFKHKKQWFYFKFPKVLKNFNNKY